MPAFRAPFGRRVPVPGLAWVLLFCRSRAVAPEAGEVGVSCLQDRPFTSIAVRLTDNGRSLCSAARTSPFDGHGQERVLRIGLPSPMRTN